MDIHARQNQVLKIMQKNENKQEYNKALFLFSLGVVLHALTCLNNPKKLNTADYIGVPAFGVSCKWAHSLHKKEERGQKLWHLLQAKSAQIA